MLHDRIANAFNLQINKTFGHKPEVLKYLMGHPNRLKTIDNVSVQVRIAELNPHIRLNGDKIDSLSKDVANMFCNAAIAAKEFEIRTDDQRRKEQKAIADERMINELDETAKELGLIDAIRPSSF